MNNSLSPEEVSSTDLLVDSDEILLDEKDDDVAIITPESEIDTEHPSVVRADDIDAVRDIVLPPLAEQAPILEDAHHVWEIEDWLALPKRAHGPVFEAGGFPWRVLLFPNGNNSDNASLYLEHGYEDNKPPDDYVCCVQFGLILWNPEDPEIYSHHQATHRFTKEEGDWGFTRFVELRKLRNSPFDERGRHLMPSSHRLNVTTFIRIVKDETGVLWHNFTNYDSKTETGYVGLKNQGATCYLNSLIQSLYFTNAFRKAVYQIPTQNEEDTKNSAYTLQRLFYQLQNSKNAVSTNELTRSFGWEARHVFEQQDVQELSRKLMEKMEEKMKGTVAENFLPKLFSGKLRTYISCQNVDYESRRVEDFWDVQLNVRGQKTLQASFEDYVAIERMEGDNRYYAGDEHKLQDADKGVIFESFPDVLHLQLKRFEYDFERDAMTKLNEFYEFPESFDAAPYLATEIDRSESWEYQLHGVLVHSGDLNAGHYYAFIKPNKDGWFYKYDDDRVTKATMREVLNENFGGPFLTATGQPQTYKGQLAMRTMNAYMLVYIRKSRVDTVLLPLTEEDTPAHLQQKLDEEAALREARKKERDEQHLYLGVKVITDDTFRSYGGTDLAVFGDVHEDDPSAPRYYRVLRKSTIKEFAEKVAQDTKIQAARLRFWCMVNRQNKTTRPDTPITDSSLTIEETYHRHSGTKTAELRLWCEIAEEVTPDGQAIWPNSQLLTNGHTTPKAESIVLFLKHFNVEEQTLYGAGHIYIGREKKVEDLVPIIMKKMGWPEKSPSGEKNQLKLFEEIKPAMIEAMKAKQTLKAAELQDGDIICFQVADTKSPEPRAATESIQDVTSPEANSTRPAVERIEDARAFYDFLNHKRDVKFYPHPVRNQKAEELEQFILTLNTRFSYDQVAAKVAERVNVEPTHLRFWTSNTTTNQPKGSVKRTQGQTLQTILNPPYVSYNTSQHNDTLFYEILEMSLSELDTKKSIRIYLISEGITKEEMYEVLVPKNGNIQDIIDALIKKAQLEDEATAGPMRLLECHSNRITREPLRESQIINIQDWNQLIIERVPKDEAEAAEGAFIPAFHFQVEPNKVHGIPFKFLILPDEPFSETRKRLEKRTGLKGKNLEKIKFAIVKRSFYSAPKYLNDDDILFEIIDPDSDSLGLDHIDRSRSQRNGAGDLFLK